MREYDEYTLKVSERVLKKSDEIIKQRQIKVSKIRHISFAVLGLCVAAIVFFCALKLSNYTKEPNINNNNPNPTSETNIEKNSTTTSTTTLAGSATIVTETSIATTEDNEIISTKATTKATTVKTTTKKVTTTKIVTTTVITTTISVKSTLCGDVNCDGIINIYDLECLSNYFKDPIAYPLSKEGEINAHMNIGAGLNKWDIYPLICYLAGTVKELPTNDYTVQRFEEVKADADRDGDVDFDDFNTMMKYSTILNNPGGTDTYEQYRINVAKVGALGNGQGKYPLPYMLDYLSGFGGKDYDFRSFLLNPHSDHMKFEITTDPNYGDYNCDGVIDIIDCDEMQDLINQVEDYKKRLADDPNAIRITNVVTAQGLRNADVYNPGTGITEEDVQAILDYINADAILPVIKDGYVRYTPTAGDFNCDNHVNLGDAIQLWEYLEKELSGRDYDPSEQGKKNADLVQDSKLDYADLEQMLNAIKAGRSLQQ